MVDDNKYNIYKINTKKQLRKLSKRDKQRLLIILTIILIFLCLIIILSHITRAINEYKVYKQYEAQIETLKYQEKERQEKIEAEKERIRLERIPKLTEIGKNNIENIYHSETKIAFLTFDDGPSSVTPTILEILNKENIKATFFVLGSQVEKTPEMVKEMYNQGHYIANHGYSHVYSSIYSSPQAVLDEYNLCNNLVKEAINVPEYNSHLFRFPGGLPGGKYSEIKLQARELLNQNEVLNIDWNALNGDAETNDLSSEFEMQRLRETTENKNSIVVLMHDAPAKSVTAETLPQIIAYLREQGYEFKNFYDIIK